MTLSVQGLMNSPLGVGFALGLSRLLPGFVGYRVAGVAAKRIAARKNLAMVRAVRANQWVIRGERPSAAELDAAVKATFAHTARCLFDLYHNLHDLEKMRRLIKFSPRVEQLFARIDSEKEPTIVVGAHLSNFDFVGQAAAMQGMRALALSYPQPNQGYQWQNRMREYAGLEMMPTSVSGMRAATKRLEACGTVLTGVDRPVTEPRYKPLFFGRRAAVPVHYVSLALKTGAPVFVAGTIMGPDGIYQVELSDAIYMERLSSRQEDLIHNAERVLAVAAGFIRQAPQQWSMPYAVWPEAVEEAPN